MTPLSRVQAQLPCSFCRDDIGDLGVIVTEAIRMCVPCGLRLRDVIDAQIAVFKTRPKNG